MTAYRAAVVGAGPAGFYAADQLLGSGFEVDLLDALPTPFGLVRSGVAPDHPNIKAVTRVYEKTAARPGFRFFGGVALGEHVSRPELLERYHAVVYAIGTPDDNRLGIAGEDLLGSHSATRFVAWYNGHPHAADEEFDLGAERAVVIGNGNVAVDVARMLVLHPDELRCTDVADHALEVFSGSGVREVVLVGRRGPAQAAFTNPELRELGELQRADVIVDPAELEGVEPPEEATKRRNVETLQSYAGRPSGSKSHRVVLSFLRSPVEIVGDEEGRVRGLRVVRNRLDHTGRAVPTEDEELIECGSVFRSIGYRGRPLDGVPFDERRGVIRNEGGRVCDEHHDPCRGEYAVGWIKRGPSGVIGTNKKDAAETVKRILEDRDAGVLNEAQDAEPDAAAQLYARSAAVSWQGWAAIDAHERARGEPAGRPRIKVVDAQELRAVSGGGCHTTTGTALR
jgi:ferredoxin/flavodoxin---NADP+ reductase